MYKQSATETMIHDEICTYEVCKLAKKKGFPIECDLFYNLNGELCDDRNYDSFDNKIGCYAPTQSLLQRWLREEKHCNIEIAVCPAPISIWIFVWSVSYGSDSHYSHRCNYDTYELALEDALKYALENLV